MGGVCAMSDFPKEEFDSALTELKEAIVEAENALPENATTEVLKSIEDLLEK